MQAEQVLHEAVDGGALARHQLDTAGTAARLGDATEGVDGQATHPLSHGHRRRAQPVHVGEEATRDLGVDAEAGRALLEGGDRQIIQDKRFIHSTAETITAALRCLRRC